jgi:hypothetical protein
MADYVVFALRSAAAEQSFLQGRRQGQIVTVTPPPRNVWSAVLHTETVV